MERKKTDCSALLSAHSKQRKVRCGVVLHRESHIGLVYPDSDKIGVWMDNPHDKLILPRTSATDYSDISFTLCIPRKTPTNYESNYVDVTAPMGALVTLDGAPLSFQPIGTTGYGLARVTALSAGPGADGNHSIQGDQGFGITVYGYGQYTSYWYPGGLNLDTIIN